ncbi:pdu/cob regulatory protein pocR [Citrobacter koseri]|uniref:Pdu/cob regulatory protein pocR n=1 Tax=Citrobacter koseri TaxID=545 RepID=A0A447UHF9_CITKO|nr:pdu/cob regulatory protein pocR [Citrobacter koseri]
MISASALNSELINKIAQDFAQATSLAVVVVNIHGDEISELFNFTPFCQLMRQHPQHSIRCRMSDRCGGLEASKSDQPCILSLPCRANRFLHSFGDCRSSGGVCVMRSGTFKR